MSPVDRLTGLSPERRALFERLSRATDGSHEDKGGIPRRAPGSRSELSFAQQRLWFLDQLAPGNAFYNISIALRSLAPLNVAAFERAINQIVERHESLRTTFIAHDGRPTQVIAERLHIPVPIVDLRAGPLAAREAEARHRIEVDARTPFDLARGPLLRTTLLQLGEADYFFLLSAHHIVADGWSMGLFSRELAALYPATLMGRPTPLPELPIQYADFAAWQRRWLQGDVLGRHLGYWKTQLAGLPTLPLVTDHPRPSVQAFHGAFHPFDLDAVLTDRLRALSRTEGVTLFMTHLAAFAVLLHRYTGEVDIVIGSPAAGRTRRELELLIGFFVNSLVMRIDLSGDPTFSELLQRVQRTALDAFKYQDLPFETLVEELHPVRDASRNPLFQVTFQLFT